MPPSQAALDWAATFGSDFLGAWNGCPDGEWLFFLMLVVATGADAEGQAAIQRAIDASMEASPTAPFSGLSADALRQLVDGKRLLSGAGLIFV
jgi:hypothetical protein